MMHSTFYDDDDDFNDLISLVTYDLSFLPQNNTNKQL